MRNEVYSQQMGAAFLRILIAWTNFDTTDLIPGASIGLLTLMCWFYQPMTQDDIRWCAVFLSSMTEHDAVPSRYVDPYALWQVNQV